MYQNKSYRMFLSTAVTAAVVVSAGAPIAPMSVQAEVKDFSDIAPNAYYSEAVKDLANKGVIQGFSDGTFRPTQQMTRAEAAKMIVNMLGLSTNNNANTSFSDVTVGSWYTPYVAILNEKGIVGGYSDGTFKPNETITRAQMAKMLVNAFDALEEGVSSSFTDVNADSWYAPYVGALVEKEITTGTTKETFAPNQKVTRAEAATFLYRVNQLDENLQTIEKITDNQVTINGMDYTISEELKGIFNSTNQAALTNANVSVVIIEGRITKITKLVLTTNGVEGTLVEFNANNATVNGDVRIHADYVSVKNLKVTGDLEVSEKAKNVFYSNGITVEGQVIISEAKVSAAMFSMLATQSTVVTFENANLNSVDIRKSDVRVEPKGNTTVKEISLSANNAIVEATEGVKIPAVTVKDGVSSVEINATVENLSINTSKEISVAGKGNIGTLNAQGSGALNLNTTGKIGNVIIPAGKNAADMIKNFEQVKSNIEKVGGVTNPTYTPPVQTPAVGGGGGGGSSTGSNVLAKAKTTAITELEGYKVATEYRAAEQTVLATAILNGTAAINAATTTEGVTTALAATKVVIDGIKTAAQLTAEEGNEALAIAKTTAIAELEGYKVAIDYREAEQAILATAIIDGKAAINAAPTIEGVTTALAAVKVVIDGIKTDLELTIVDQVIAKIAELPAAGEITLVNQTAVFEAKSAYDSLTLEQKALVNEENKTKLEEALTKIDELNQELFKFTPNTDETVTITGLNAGRTDTNIVIPAMLDGKMVTSIGYEAFYQNGLTAVVIPESVTSIEGYAFAMNELETVTIPENVTSVGDSAFSNNKLTTVTIPESVTSIEGYAFFNNQLITVTIPESVTSIEEYVFANNQLISVVIPGSVTSIGECAFDSNNLTNVTIPGSVTSIGIDAFDNNQLTTVVIQEGVESIGESAFSPNKLTTVTIPGSVTSIGNWAFSYNELATVVIQEGVESIGNGAFYDNNLTTVIIPESVTSIGNEVFANNENLNRITIGNGVNIGEYLNSNTNNFFKEAYLSKFGGAGTYLKQQDGTWINVNFQAPMIVEVKKIASANGYDKVQIKFSEPILDSTVDENSFGIIGTDSNNYNGLASISSFSTSRSDGTIETNPDNDEYITISFNEKTTVDSLSYTKDKPLDYGVAQNLTDLTGNLLETQTITPID